jgi:hypothetical protein
MMFTTFKSFLLLMASSASLKGTHNLKLSVSFIATGLAIANGLHIGEDSNTATDAFPDGLEMHQDGSKNVLLRGKRRLSSKAGKGSKKYSSYESVIKAVNYVINIEDNCQSEVDELEECYEEEQAELEECVNCAWIEVLSGTADIHCDDEILAVLETKAAECDRCLAECGEQQASLLSCAVDLYCPMDDEEGIEVSQYHARVLIPLYCIHNS